MKKFKDIFKEERPAADYVAPKDDDDEVKKYKPRSKGEQEFKDKHKVELKKHPVASDDVFNGDVKTGNPDEHKGPGSKHGGETQPVKQGSTDTKTSATAKSDPRTQNRPGEKAPVMQGSSKVRESFSAFTKE